MNDRELLEMAAKAVGYYEIADDLWCNRDDYLNPFRWNPLTDDGDALRLAVALKLEIINDDYMVIARQINPHKHGAQESLSTDSHAATRRAIVRAAAAIGAAL